MGDSASAVKVFAENEVELFAQVSEDRNPVHFDEAFAAKTRFGKRIVHGLAYSSLLSGLLGKLHLSPFNRDPTPGISKLRKESKSRITTDLTPLLPYYPLPYSLVGQSSQGVEGEGRE